jgi:hypothetical protein
VARSECEDEPGQRHRDSGPPGPAQAPAGEAADDRGREQQLADEMLGHAPDAAAGREVAGVGVEQRRAELGGEQRGCERGADEAEEREMGPRSRGQPGADLAVRPADREPAGHGDEEPGNEDEPDRRDPDVVEGEEDEQAGEARQRARAQRGGELEASDPGRHHREDGERRPLFPG